jgi:hypothetical protein
LFGNVGNEVNELKLQFKKVTGLGSDGRLVKKLFEQFKL